MLKTILDPGDEVIVLAPYFVEYFFYIDNHGGIPVIVNTSPDTFQPDPQEIAAHITPRTKAVIINSPNNPTGVVYSEQSLQRMSVVLAAKEKEYGSTIYVLSDEPYNKLVYDGVILPQVLQIFKNSFADQFSKSLSFRRRTVNCCKPCFTRLQTDYERSGFVIASWALSMPRHDPEGCAGSLGEAAEVDRYRENAIFSIIILSSWFFLP